LRLLGHIAWAVEHMVFFFGAMALIVAGNGFFKPNISTLVGKLYEQDDPRRDGAFTIFYMGINIGAGLAPLLCGYLGEKIGWHWGFSLAAVGMAIGLLVFWWGTRFLGDHGQPPRREALRETLGGVLPKTWALYLAILVFIPFAAYLFTVPSWVQWSVYVIGPVFLAYVLFEAFRCDRQDRDRLIVAVVLSLFSIIFWACFEQAGSSMTLFADREVDRVVFGYELTASQLLSINPLFIVLLGIPFSILWTKLGRIGKNPSSPVKFGFGLFQLALGFVALVMAANQAKTSGSASLGWMMLAYLLHTTGELCLSPVGLSAVTKLSPARLTGLMMGFWFFCAAFAGISAGVIAKFTSGDAGYEEVFRILVYVGIGAGCLILLLSPLLKRMLHGVK
ncbi:MAG: peptide MFS transporter, partial [Phycisphaerae bacterium]